METNTYEIDLLDFAECKAEQTDEKLNFETVGDVLTYYVNNYGGKIDLHKMSQISNYSVEQLANDLSGIIFQDPSAFEENEPYEISKGWVLSPVYLSGNIRRKLELAIQKNCIFRGLFEKNVDTLKKILPGNVGFEDIHVELGAVFVDEEIYSKFIKDILNLRTAPVVKYIRELSVWRIESSKCSNNVLNRYIYGTSDISAIKIIEHTMNCKTIKIYNYFTNSKGNSDKTLNQSKTLEAQEKQKELSERFREWISSDPEIYKAIEERYNNEYACYAHSYYDGSFLELKDINPEIKLYKHQKDAVARVLLSDSNVLFSHEVGSGKTNIMCVSAHELYRTGVSKTNLIVVPNNVLGAAISMHKELYPADNILEIYPKDFTPKRRNDALYKIKYGDYVAIYMAYSSYDMLIMSKKYWIEKYFSDIQRIKSAILSTTDSKKKSLLTSEAHKVAKKLDKYLIGYTDPPFDTFDKLGIETIFLDEAHNYKNIEIKTRADNIVGLNNNGSKRCIENLEKIHSVKKAVFLTGTPLTNSLADLYALMLYLQPHELSALNLTFDNWIHVYAEKTEDFECDVANNLKLTTRFRQFNNISELCTLFSNVHDHHKIDKDAFDVPDVIYDEIVVRRNAQQEIYIKNLAKRVDAVHCKEIPPSEDNLLKITTDGRKAALDIRLVDADAPQECEGKIKACALKIMEMYKKYPDKCQVVFCDIGTPKDSFNVYDELKDNLSALGMDRSSIAFVHDATTENERKKLFRKVNNAEISVIIGSTSKLGTGTNIQENLIAAHHLDVPWRPADMVQREGRIIRQGNINDTIFIFRYVTEKSFDAFSWQLLHNKQRFIASFLSGCATAREIDDIAQTVLTYSEIKALAIGDPLIRERIETSNLLERSKIAFRQRQRQLSDMLKIIQTTPARISGANKRIYECQLDMNLYKQTKASISVEERRAFGEELLSALRTNAYKEKERLFDKYQGFAVWLPSYMKPDKPYIYIKSTSGGIYDVTMDTDRPLGVTRKIDHILDNFHTRLHDLNAYVAKLRSDIKSAREDYDKGNEHAVIIELLQIKLNDIDMKIANGGKK